MGMEMKLIVIRDSADVWIGSTILQLPKAYGLFEAINLIKQEPIPDYFNSFLATGEDGEPTYGVMSTTPYGERITYTTVADLLKLRRHEEVLEYPTVRAAWAYLACLPKSTKIALYWH